MADAKPTGKLTTGAIGNFLLGAALILMFVGGAGAMLSGGVAGVETAAIFMLIGAVLIVGGGICGGIGWLGLGSMYGGTNTIAAIFSFLFGAAPLVLLIVGSAGAGREGGGIIGMIFMIFVPGLLGLLGGLGAMGGKSSLAKPGGIVLLVGGIATLALGVFALARIGSPEIAQILVYVAFFGTAVGFFLTGAAMLGEKNA